MNENDYERIANEIDRILAMFIGNAHEPGEYNDSLTMTKDGFIIGIIRCQRLHDWVMGLAITHNTEKKDASKEGE